jgi:starch synthase
VRKTGGLTDTIADYNPQRQTGNGFVFEKYRSDQMLKAIKRAIALFKNREKWYNMMLRAMDYDFSWDASAKKYIELYKRALNEE